MDTELYELIDYITVELAVEIIREKLIHTREDLVKYMTMAFEAWGEPLEEVEEYIDSLWNDKDSFEDNVEWCLREHWAYETLAELAEDEIKAAAEEQEREDRDYEAELEYMRTHPL